MKQLKKYCVCLLLLATLVFVTACGSRNNDNGTDNAGTNTAVDDAAGNGADDAAGNGVNIDDILFDTDGDGVYDHTDVDGDGLLEEIGRDANDMVDDLVNDVTGDGDTLTDGMDGTMDDGGAVEGGTVEGGNGTVTQ